VIDYKSGSKQFDLAALYYGLQLQLVVYMNVALELAGRDHPGKEAVPAALLYYHVADPMVKEEERLSPEEINRLVMRELRMTGIVNEKEEVIEMLDGDFAGTSLVLPVERKKDGSLSKRSDVMNEREFQMVSDYATEKIRRFGQEIKKGNIAVNPYEDGQSCLYCAYRVVCGYDVRIPGYRERKMEELSAADVMERMREDLYNR
jgi:ATP-dependent helicase/nuclease subunit B